MTCHLICVLQKAQKAKKPGLLFTALFNSTPSGLITLQDGFNISCAHAICTSQFNTS